MKRLPQNGDTIVEVLIAIVIASVVLVGAYSAASRSSQSIRMAQERAVGSKYATSAVEKLRARSDYYRGLAHTSFCIDGTSQTSASSCPADTLSGEQPSYYTLITKTTGSTQTTYTVTTEWDSLRGGKETVVYEYRTQK